MRLLTGPAGSGKTTFVLERFREALRNRNQNIRLLVPTATLAQHLQNQMVREGFVFRPSLVQTLWTFAEGHAGGVRQAPDTVLSLLAEDAALRLNRPEFARVVQMPGFRTSLAKTILELSSAGAASVRLAACLPDAPLAPAFLAVYREVEAALEKRGMALRGAWLERAAERIARDGAGGIETIWLDGFHALPDPELRFIAALSRHAGLTLTLGDEDLEPTLLARLHEIGFREERSLRTRPAPVLALVKAPSMEREVDEIARRILEQAAAGRPFREMAIVVRQRDAYEPLLRTTLERFGIPARFYFEPSLQQHAVVRYLCGAVDAMLSGWDHARTLKVLRLAPRFARSNAMDRFDFAVRQQVPNSGLGALRSLLMGEGDEPLSAGAGRLLHKIDALAAIEEWRSYSLLPKDWAALFRTLRNVFRPARPPDGAGHQTAMVWRSQALALRLFDEAAEEAALAMEPAIETGLETYWRAVQSVLRQKPLRLEDGRRDVVHVLSAHETRQWVLPVVFVCGLVEKQFPALHPQDTFFPDRARAELNGAGIRVRTAAAFEREERALFDSAISRATLLTTLSYPEFDARGDRNLPSLFLEDLRLAPQDSRTVRPLPRHAPGGPVTGIHAPALLDRVRQKTEKLSPTSLELYLQCPFQYFGARTLRLEPAPAIPSQRLDFLTQGSIVHEVLAEWWANPQEMAPLFEEVFAGHCEEKRIPPGYRTERLRHAMRADLEAFAADQRWPRAGFQSRTEEKFEFSLDHGLTISGQIDRLDTAPDGSAWVIDYKYSGTAGIKDRVKNENLLQAPLYLMAAGRVFGVRPSGMFFVGLKGGVVYAGWRTEQGTALPHLEGEPLPRDWMEKAAGRTQAAADEIRAGRTAPHPADVNRCRYCDYRDVCRVEVRRQEPVEEGA